MGKSVYLEECKAASNRLCTRIFPLVQPHQYFIKHSRSPCIFTNIIMVSKERELTLPLDSSLLSIKLIGIFLFSGAASNSSSKSEKGSSSFRSTGSSEPVLIEFAGGPN
ncbi:hypothetical protein SAY86_025604 [Trapa natans]|uniref:Uncharacterized protein n=1 Tax=Trapa natans TaxID=22666 RepID=A0AAN7RCH8_TRANT|nr:hypothetical protein SAY86_025604 [Trapa natans]